jgi:hypothetical protein
MATDFATLSLTEIHAEIDAVSRDAEATISGLTAPQLNWKPAPHMPELHRDVILHGSESLNRRYSRCVVQLNSRASQPARRF